VAKHGGPLAATPHDAVKGAEYVMACVGNDDDLRSICLGEAGAFAGMAKGAVFVDHTTVSAKVTRELSALADKAGLGFVDAPVSGGQAGAEKGVLSIMCGGTEADYARAEPIMQAYARICRRLGDSGAGQLAKMMNQICIAGLVQGLAEALAFGQKAGLDGEAVVEVISQGAAGSWQMVNRHKTMLADQFDFGFAVDWMRKDLKICLETADELGAALPVTALVDQFYKDVQNLGGPRNDTSSLIRRLK
jgi:3-hydroxyisobutyrate dehydrogenase